MRILITGAHFTPAVAVIEELKKQKNIKIIYVGRKTTLEGDKTSSIESKILPKLGVKFIPITTGRLQRSFTIYTIPSLFKIPIGLIQSFWIILSQKPDVILSFGGYAAVPIVIVGWLFSIPIIVHEQTLAAGLANKISSLFADKKAVSFPKKLDKKTILTGNPLRQEILHPSKNIPSHYQKLFSIAKKEKLPVLIIMGGNQGSHTINKVVEEILAKLLKIACVIHVAGNNKFKDYERLENREGLGKLGDRYLIKKWIGEEIGAILNKVDLAICRAGANTLLELTFMGIPALVIPFEPLYNDEQTKNAKYFEKADLLEILSQNKLTGQTLLQKVKNILNDLNHFQKKAKQAKEVVIPDAAKRLALETVLLVSK